MGAAWQPEQHVVVPLACWPAGLVSPLSIRNERTQAAEPDRPVDSCSCSVCTCCVTLGRSLSLSEPSFLANGNDDARFTDGVT